METLEKLSKFTETYPQVKGGKVQYSFLGGTAVRLNQEMVGVIYEVRQISDFDLLVIDGKDPYPVHQCDLDKVYGISSMSRDNVLNYVIDAEVRGKRYYFMDGTFLAFTKTCAVDNPREKDFDDVSMLNSLGLVDFKRLRGLYKRSERMTKNSDLAVDTLKYLLDFQSPENIKIFQSFPRLINLLDEFPDHKRAMQRIKEALANNGRTGYEMSSVIYDIHTVIREVRQSNRMDALNALLHIAQRNDYRDFDSLVHHDILLKFRYAQSSRKERKLIERLAN